MAVQVPSACQNSLGPRRDLESTAFYVQIRSILFTRNTLVKPWHLCYIIHMEYDFSNAQIGLAEKTRTELPPLYKVVLFNDDFTTKDFVVSVLCHVFHKTKEQAVQIMESVHKSGKGIAGVYSFDIAATRAQTAMHYARQAGFPMRCGLEQD